MVNVLNPHKLLNYYRTALQQRLGALPVAPGPHQEAEATIEVSALGGILPAMQNPMLGGGGIPPGGQPAPGPAPKGVPPGMTPASEESKTAFIAYIDELMDMQHLPEGTPEREEAEQRADMLWEMIHGGDEGDGRDDSPPSGGFVENSAQKEGKNSPNSGGLQEKLSNLPYGIVSVKFLDNGPWITWRGPRGGIGWKNTQTGAIVYNKNPNAPGHMRRQREASGARAKQLGEQVEAHYHNPQENHAPSEEHLQELATHLPKMSVEHLKQLRGKLMASFGGGKRREQMVTALRKHVADLVSEHQKSQGKQLFPGNQGRTQQAYARQEAAEKRGPRPGSVKMVPTGDLHIDPERFQFKQNVDKQGVTDEMKGVKQFNPDLAGVISAWHDPEQNKTFVVNGHHRAELAKRTGHPQLAVRYLAAKNAEEARAKGAIINIAEGKGTPVDAAKFMRDMDLQPEDLAKHGVSLKGALARDAGHLRNLSDPLFHKVARGQMDTDRAVAIGQHLAGKHDLQNQLASYIDKREEATGREWTPKQVAEAAREVATSPTQTTEDGGLFGGTTESSRLEERAALKSHVRNELAKSTRDYEAVSSERRAGNVSGAGNVLNTAKNKELAQQHAQHAELFDKLANYKGPVADLINQASEDYADAPKAKRASIQAKLTGDIRDLLAKHGPALAEQGGGVVSHSNAGVAATGSHAAERGQLPGSGAADEQQPGDADSTSGTEAEASVKAVEPKRVPINDPSLDAPRTLEAAPKVEDTATHAAAHPEDHNYLKLIHDAQAGKSPEELGKLAQASAQFAQRQMAEFGEGSAEHRKAQAGTALMHELMAKKALGAKSEPQTPGEAVNVPTASHGRLPMKLTFAKPGEAAHEHTSEHGHQIKAWQGESGNKYLQVSHPGKVGGHPQTFVNQGEKGRFIGVSGRTPGSAVPHPLEHEYEPPTGQKAPATEPVRAFDPEAKPGEAPPKDKPITLLYGGSFSPVHQGHVEALRKAKTHMESQGYKVGNVVVAPSADKLLKAKLGDNLVPLKDRTAMAQHTFGQEAGVAVTSGPGEEAEAYQGKLKRTQLADWAAKHYPGTRIVNVTGQDAAPGSPKSFPSIYSGDAGTSHEGYYYAAMPRDENDPNNISSSAIRKAIADGKPLPQNWMHPDAEKYYRNYLSQKQGGKLSAEDYTQQAMANLLKTSRTAAGVVDTSASAGKAAQMAEGLTGDKAKEAAINNFKETIGKIHQASQNPPKTGKEMADFADQVALGINKGILKPGALLRTDNSAKFPYTNAADLPLAREQFGEELAKRLNDPNADPVETAAWIEWRANLRDHFWADGVGKTSKALAALPLMKAGLPLPNYGPNKEFFRYSGADGATPHEPSSYTDNERYRNFVQYYRTLMPGYNGPPAPEPFDESRGLTPEERKLERSSQEYARANYDKIKGQYLEENGVKDGAGGYKSVQINTDEWRHHLPGYIGTNAGAVHEAASWLNKKFYSEMLQAQKGKGNGEMLVLAGGGGSGKGTATKDFFHLEDYPLILDQVSDNREKLEDKLNEAKANGYQPTFAFIDRDPHEAVINGVAGRAEHLHEKKELPRTVNLQMALEANTKARQVALEMLQLHPELPPNVVDNRNGDKGRRRLLEDRAEAMEYLQKNLANDQEKLKQKPLQDIHQEVFDRQRAKNIPSHITEALLGKENFAKLQNNLANPTNNLQEGENVDPTRVHGPESLPRDDAARSVLQKSEVDRQRELSRVTGNANDGGTVQRGTAGVLGGTGNQKPRDASVAQPRDDEAFAIDAQRRQAEAEQRDADEKANKTRNPWGAGWKDPNIEDVYSGAKQSVTSDRNAVPLTPEQHQANLDYAAKRNTAKPETQYPTPTPEEAQALDEARQQGKGKGNENQPQTTPTPPDVAAVGTKTPSVLANPHLALADSLQEKFDHNEPIDAKTLFALADQHHGGTRGAGTYGPSDAYDSLEAGFNQHLRDHTDPTANLADAQEQARQLKAKLDSLPTQTNRSGNKESHQQFSTPPHYAFAANWLANLNPNDHVLEPSAGTGSLAVHAANAGAKVTANEYDPRRADFLKGQFGDKNVHVEDAKLLSGILPSRGVQAPTAVVMNPPFSQTAGQMGDKKELMTAANHIGEALKGLADNGRLVAIVGRGMTPESPTYKRWFKEMAKKYNLRANVGVSGEEYKKYGTHFGTRMLVFDKSGPQQGEPVVGDAQDIPDLMAKLEGVRNDRPSVAGVTTAQQPPVEQAGGANPPSGGPTPVEPNAAPPTTGGSVAPTRTGQQPPVERVPDGDAGLGNAGAGGRSGTRGATGSTGRVQSTGEDSEPTGTGDGVNPSGTPTPAEPAQPGKKPARGGKGTRRKRVLEPEIRLPNLRASEPVAHKRREVGPIPSETDGGTAESKAIREQQEANNSIFEPYQPSSLSFPGAKKHPTPLVETAAMAGIKAPHPTYRPHLSPDLINQSQNLQVIDADGTVRHRSMGVSEAALEAITHAGEAHSKMLPAAEGATPFRRGILIGDGTGTGKGREIAGMIGDNWNQGRKKHVWISEKWPLMEDAKRDLADTGTHPDNVLGFDDLKKGNFQQPSGVAFLTYDTLRQKHDEPESNLNNLVKWLGKDFDGVLAFDEAHAMGNASTVKGKRGQTDPSQRALAGLKLQQMLPNARVVYVSATGATEVRNLAYAERLGIWGHGTPFANRDDFVSKISQGGTAAMEAAAQSMKAQGMYMARQLAMSDGTENGTVSFDRLAHTLTPEQRYMHGKVSEAWQKVLGRIDDAIKSTTPSGNNGKPVKNGGNQRSAALSQFWGAQQRFHNQVLTSFMVPTLIKNAEADLKAGRAPVISLVNTMESALKRAAKGKAADEDLEELDLSPKQVLTQYLDNCFPIHMQSVSKDENGNTIVELAKDSNGNPIVDPHALRMREELKADVNELKIPDSPIDQILQHFGHENVAEVTGRTTRPVYKRDPKTGEMVKVMERRDSAHANTTEANDFQNGKKKILIFSEAGGTGRSYHAEKGAGNQGRRVHYMLQPGWRADKAVQALGRTHRTNQTSAPIVKLMEIPEVPGQRRFISTIARRLSQLGALTRGERKAGGGGLFKDSDNLEHPVAQDALNAFFEDMRHGRVEGLPYQQTMEQLGLKDKAERENQQKATQDIPMTQFMNRLLSADLPTQQKIMDAFETKMQDQFDLARANGKLDEGVENFNQQNNVESITPNKSRVVFRDPQTGAEVRHIQTTSRVRLARNSFPGSYHPETGRINYVTNNKTGKIFAVYPTSNGNDPKTGQVIPRYRLQTVTGSSRNLPKDQVTTHYNGNYTAVHDHNDAEEEWNKQAKALPSHETLTHNFISGAMLPVWDRLPSDNPRVFKVKFDDGSSMVGRQLHDDQVEPTLQALSAGQKLDDEGGESSEPQHTPESVHEKLRGGKHKYDLTNGWTLRPARVQGEQRLELKGPLSMHYPDLERQGVFRETIGSDRRYFVPNDKAKGEKTLKSLLQQYPVKKVSGLREEQQQQAIPEEVTNSVTPSVTSQPTQRESATKVTDSMPSQTVTNSVTPSVTNDATNADPDGDYGDHLKPEGYPTKEAYKQAEFARLKRVFSKRGDDIDDELLDAQATVNAEDNWKDSHAMNVGDTVYVNGEPHNYRGTHQLNGEPHAVVVPHGRGGQYSVPLSEVKREQVPANPWDAVPAQGKEHFENHVLAPMRKTISDFERSAKTMGPVAAHTAFTDAGRKPLAPPSNPTWETAVKANGLNADELHEAHPEYQQLKQKLAELNDTPNDVIAGTPDPHQQTQGEYVAGRNVDHDNNSAKLMHKMAVMQAMTGGRPIPQKVQDDYPDLFGNDLAAKYQHGGTITPDEGSRLRDAYEKTPEEQKASWAERFGIDKASKALPETRDDLVHRKIREAIHRSRKEARGEAPDLHKGGLFAPRGEGEKGGLFAPRGEGEKRDLFDDPDADRGEVWTEYSPGVLRDLLHDAKEKYKDTPHTDLRGAIHHDTLYLDRMSAADLRPAAKEIGVATTAQMSPEEIRRAIRDRIEQSLGGQQQNNLSEKIGATNYFGNNNQEETNNPMSPDQTVRKPMTETISKNPWEMTVQEFADAKIPTNGWNVGKAHEIAVVKAIKEGREVPEHVSDQHANTVEARERAKLAKQYGADWETKLKEKASFASPVHTIEQDQGDGNLLVRQKQNPKGGFESHSKGQIVVLPGKGNEPKIVSKANKPYTGRSDAGVHGYYQQIAVRDPKPKELEDAKRAIAAMRAIAHGGEPRNDSYAGLKKKQMAEYVAAVHAALGEQAN